MVSQESPKRAAGVCGAGRVGLALGAFQTPPGAQAHDLGLAFVQAYQAAGVARKVVRVEGHLGFHLQDRLLAHRVEQLGLAAEVVVDLRLIGAGRLPDPVDARSGDPVLGELCVGRVQHAAAGGPGVVGSHAAQQLA
ncbi:MAG: putative transcriptional regulator, TetR family protein [Actinomycetia bacterium]|nr:putative transcriptional regulator, TetR family protein [Actinomycetes bacterium]